MSSSTAATGGDKPPSATIATSNNFQKSFGLGQAFAIALGFLLLIYALAVAIYSCCRSKRNHQNHARSASDVGGIIVPREFSVAEESDGEIAVVGLDEAAINSYPSVPFSKEEMGLNESTCSICLCDYKVAEMLRMLPDCRHCFHLSCVDAWLKMNGSCPVCRNSPLPTPISTPLSEVVPLSQYSDGQRRL